MQTTKNCENQYKSLRFKFLFSFFCDNNFRDLFLSVRSPAIFLHFMLNMQIKKFTFFRRLAVFIFRNGISMQKNNILRRLYDTKKALCKARNWYLLRFFVLFVPSCLVVESFSGSGKHLHSSASRFLRKNHKTQTATISLAKSLFAFVDLGIFARVLSSAIKISPQDDDEGLKIKSSTNVCLECLFICDLWLSAIRMIMKIEMTNK